MKITKLIPTILGSSPAAISLVKMLNTDDPNDNKIRAYITTKIIETREIFDCLAVIKNSSIRRYLAHIHRDRALDILNEYGFKLNNKRIITFAKNVIVASFKNFIKET